MFLSCFLGIIMLLYVEVTVARSSRHLFGRRRFPFLSMNVASHLSTVRDLQGDHVSSAVTNPGSVEVQDEPESRKLDALFKKYPNYVSKVEQPGCDIFLCGTVHVGNLSTDLVRDTIRCVQPSAVVLELCPDRMGHLEERGSPTPLAIRDVLRTAWRERSFYVLGTELIVWVQSKAAELMGSDVGGELLAAAQEARQCQATIVLGDRFYDVTIQRVFDKIGLLEKMWAITLLLWEVVTMTADNVKQYVTQTHNDITLVQKDIEILAKHLPAVAKVVVEERDIYLAQTLRSAAWLFTYKKNPSEPRRKIVAVVGAAHIPGIIRNIQRDGAVSEDFMHEISSSSRHPSTWPGQNQVYKVTN